MTRLKAISAALHARGEAHVYVEAAAAEAVWTNVSFGTGEQGRTAVELFRFAVERIVGKRIELRRDDNWNYSVTSDVLILETGTSTFDNTEMPWMRATCVDNQTLEKFEAALAKYAVSATKQQPVKTFN